MFLNHPTNKPLILNHTKALLLNNVTTISIKLKNHNSRLNDNRFTQE